MAFPTGWARKVKVTIQNGKVPGTLTSYPALITEVNLPQGNDEIFDADGLHAAINGGGDIRASSDAAGTTQLPLHVVSFVTDNIPANGKCELWVKIASVSSSVDTDFYIWWEKSAETQPAVGSTFGRNNVWTEAELVVLMEDSVPVDSTGNHALSLSGGLVSIDGPFGKANTFAGNDRLSNTDAALVDIPETYDTTISIISRKATYELSEAVVSFEGTDDIVIYPMDAEGANNGFRIFWRDLGGDHFDPTETLANAWIWNDFTTRASNDHEGYTNASSIGTFTTTGTAGPFSTFFIGGFTATGQDWDGDIAQIIVWATARSDAWLTAQHNNQFDPATFIIEGTPEAAAGGSVVPIIMQQVA